MPAPSAAPVGIPEPPIPTAFIPDAPLDVDWPEPPPAAPAGTIPIQPARTLIAARLLYDSSPAASGPAVRGPEPVEPIPPVTEPPAPPPATAPVPPAVLDPEATAAEPPAPEPSGRSLNTAAPPSAEQRWQAATPAMRPAAPGAAVAEAPSLPATSPFPLSLGRALVQLDGPRGRVTDQPTPTISGRVLGGAPESLVLYVNGSPTKLSMARRTFGVPVTLRPGANELRAVVTGPDGLEAEDAITVHYAPPAPSGTIALTSPPDGLTLGPEDPPVVVVEGEIGDRTAATVWIVANERRIPVAASGGRFRHVLLLSDPLVRLWAETPDGDRLLRSGAVTVRAAATRLQAGVLVMRWPTGIEESSVEISATWRAHPERLDGPVQTVRLLGAATTAHGSPSDVFFLRGLRPGVHTLIVSYRGRAPLGDVRPALYLPDNDRLTSRPVRPVSLNSGGRRVITKMLMPQAILWEQDDWFSGYSESVDTVTKFRIPDGVSWVERKDDLP